jgi:O-succinylbenzoate synthase
MRTGPPQIDGITVWAVDLPLRRPFTSATVDVAARRLAIIKIEAGGVVGWGEAAPVAGHTADFSTVWAEFADAVGKATRSLKCFSPGLARAAYEQATTDIAAKLAGRPLFEHLEATEPVFASAAIGLDYNHQPDGKSIAAAISSGYRHMKLKIDALTDPGRLRRTITDHPAVSFGADANQSLANCDSGFIEAIDGIGLAFLEQPGKAPELEWHRRLRAALATPIAVDESASSAEAIASIVSQGAADIITLKVGRFGTATTLRLAEDISSSGLQVRLGGLLESGIGRAHSVALAGRREFSVVGDIGASELYFEADLVSPPWRVRDGLLQLPTTPGIGVDVDESLLARHAFDCLLAE